jgi:hypothetical protein
VNVVILVPRRAGIKDRDRLWTFTRERWSAAHPDWPIVEGHHDDGPFNRAAAINRAARDAGDWDVALIIDADVLVDPTMVRSTVDVAACTHGLTVASPQRWMLNEQGTTKILGGFAGRWDGFVRQRYGTLDDPRGAQCSCCIAVSRQLWDQVGGFDELHVGYGWEDVSFRNACETISGKATVWLAPHPIWHLHHAPSPEDKDGGELKSKNERRARRYIDAHGDVAATRSLIDEHLAARQAVTVDEPPTRIPRILHRTVPADTTAQVEQWWSDLQHLHPGWDARTYREPIDPADWPLTGDLFARCANGAQKAGLIRLEALVTHGGVYVDSDVEPLRSLEPLMHAPAFAGWEDETTVPDAVLACEPQHPAFVAAIEKARAAIEGGGDAWRSGPGVTTELLPGRPDVLLLPPGAFYPHHYLQKHNATDAPGPWVFLRHHWHGSWLSEGQRRSIERRQR